MTTPSKQIIISTPTAWAPSDAEFEEVRTAIDLWHKVGGGAALILPSGWTFAVVEVDTPIIIESGKT